MLPVLCFLADLKLGADGNELNAEKTQKSRGIRQGDNLVGCCWLV